MKKKLSIALILTFVFPHLSFLYGDSPSIPLITQEQAIEEPGACYFIPPPNWGLVDKKHLLDDVKVMVIGKPLSVNHIPPSINLAIENTTLTQAQYLDAVEDNNKKEHDTIWSNLGTIKTNAGDMALTQIDVNTSWGNVRIIQAILVKRGKAYIITATAQLNEFIHFSDQFNKSIESFHINKDIYQLVNDKNKRKDLKNLVKLAKKKWNEDLQIAKTLQPDLSNNDLAIQLFESMTFKNQVWNPLHDKIASAYGFLGQKWQEKFFSILKDELLSIE